ncbi:MAG: hypothetical protein IPM54_31190 [Polyangiaceae bacterium]|nr:hypothetical protein [Polyangiaceae bacterium]
MKRLPRTSLASAMLVWLVPLLPMLHAGCSGDSNTNPTTGSSSGTAGAGGEGGSMGGAGGIGGDGGGGGSAGAGGSSECPACPPSFKCRYGSCIPELGSCMSFDDCPGDSYCDANGECIPYGVPADVVNDPTCQKENNPNGVKPVVQCSWEKPADAADPTINSTSIYTAPIVAELNIDKDPGKIQPSIIVTTFENVSGTRVGTLRVFDGRTCEEQMRTGGLDEPTDENRPAYGTQWAIGDLDGDVAGGGHPEIVGLHRTSGVGNDVPLELYALTIDSSGAKPALKRLWYGRTCSPNGDTPVTFASNLGNYGPGIWDLDDDGKPEVVIDQMVFDAQGCLLSVYADTFYLGHGVMSTIADVDLDMKPDLVRYDRIASWDTATTEWVDKPYFTASAAHKHGHVAVVDLGAYSTIAGQPLPNKLPEVVVVSAESTTFNPNTTGTIRAQTLDGTIVFGPIELHHDVGTPGGHGGPPTAADFDGDGQVEFAAAANQYYTVYDPDCVAALGGASPAERPGGTCIRAPGMENLPDGVLWARLSQDFSSSGTGSSVFDFDGDGNAEAVYGDECFVRVYSGKTGEVIFSASARSGTGFELPVVADVDGDFATEIVVARASGPACPASDPLFPESMGSSVMGGFAILRDPEDRWASSRPIWNQHAYSITHVTDDARIPRSSEVLPNWTQPGLNNFRQNTQGNLGLLNVADLTAVFTDLGTLCGGVAGLATLKARVCNRGTNPVQDGVTVDFLAGDTLQTSVLACTAVTTKLLLPGECEDIECTGDLPGVGDVFVVVDPAGTIADCHPGNNEGAGILQLCPK